MAILLEISKQNLKSAKHRLGDGMAVGEKCSHNHHFYVTFNFKSLDLKIRLLKGCCCFGCHLSKSPRFIAQHTCPLLHYSARNPVAGQLADSAVQWHSPCKYLSDHQMSSSHKISCRSQLANIFSWKGPTTLCSTNRLPVQFCVFTNHLCPESSLRVGQSLQAQRQEHHPGWEREMVLTTPSRQTHSLPHLSYHHYFQCVKTVMDLILMTKA